jgi:UPF0755 protein
MFKSKLFKISISILILVVLAVFLLFFTNNANIDKEEIYIEIPTGSTYDEVLKIIEPKLNNSLSFKVLSQVVSYPDNIKPGRFLLKKGMNSLDIAKSLRRNVPVKLSFNNKERIEDFCLSMDEIIEPTSDELMNVFTDSIFLATNGFTKETVISMVLPNTYEVYWNISAEKFREKMLNAYQNFWNNERIEKSTALNLTPVQVITLASIVHKESTKKDERPTVAGVYLNRLSKNMLLQADPTVIYAVKLIDNDFNQVIKRVLYKDLFVDSPYNTYKVHGLPPGPIAMPDLDAIDAVLNAEKHTYLYFCASIEKFGYHAFATTYAEHQVNAKKYADWLNKQGTLR